MRSLHHPQQMSDSNKHTSSLSRCLHENRLALGKKPSKVAVRQIRILTFRCDIPVVFYRINTICITSSNNTTKFTALYCTICYTTTCFGPFFRPSSGCICLALRILYCDDKVYYFDGEISIILTLALLWRVYRQFSMNEYRSWVWVGSDG